MKRDERKHLNQLKRQLEQKKFQHEMDVDTIDVALDFIVGALHPKMSCSMGQTPKAIQDIAKAANTILEFDR